MGGSQSKSRHHEKWVVLQSEKKLINAQAKGGAGNYP